MITYTVEYWQMNWALDRLSRWQATGVALYRDEVGQHQLVQRKGSAWWTYTNERLTQEQLGALMAKAVCAFHYKAATGTLILLFVPKFETQAASQILVSQIEKEMSGDGLRNKRQR